VSTKEHFSGRRRVAAKPSRGTRTALYLLWMAARIDTEYGDGCRARRRSAISLDIV
jgi:hypothetical protein